MTTSARPPAAPDTVRTHPAPEPVAAPGAGSSSTSSRRRRDKLDPALLRLVLILIVGLIPSLLDTTIVNVAIDSVGRDLHTTVSTIQWVITGYLLSFGMVIPLSGWALSRFGSRTVWIFSLSVFLAGSVASGAAWDIGSLIGFRVLQGAGGGLMLPLLTTLITQAAGPDRLGRLMATVSLPVAVVPILGPVISGLIISSASWRWIFFVNAPICVAGLVLAWRGLPHDRPSDADRADRGSRPAAAARPRLDVVGLLLLCPALAGLLYGLAQVSAHAGFGHPAVLIPIAAGATLLTGFIVHALRLPGEPLVDLRLFRSRGFAGASGLMFLAGLSIYGAMLLLPLYFQQARGYSALTAGLLIVPQGVGSILPRTIVGKLTDRLGPRPVSLAGIVLAGIGTVPFALATSHTSAYWLAAALVVRGAGLGAATIALMAGAFQGLTRSDLPHASSATRIAQQVGGAFGAAVLVVILASQIAAHAAAGPAATAIAFGHTFWWCVGFTALAVIPALALPGRPAAPGRADRADTDEHRTA
ncbi:MAG TPA: MDR family MFS transporter [Streptosporangiaceae bacterium]|nr:MDR family MFS transporter [Streptosporangiaceae bacterium]